MAAHDSGRAVAATTDTLRGLGRPSRLRFPDIPPQAVLQGTVRPLRRRGRPDRVEWRDAPDLESVFVGLAGGGTCGVLDLYRGGDR
jgi:hypothetical protein